MKKSLKRFCEYCDMSNLPCGKTAQFKLRNTDVFLCQKHSKQYPATLIVDKDFDK